MLRYNARSRYLRYRLLHGVELRRGIAYSNNEQHLAGCGSCLVHLNNTPKILIACEFNFNSCKIFY